MPCPCELMIFDLKVLFLPSKLDNKVKKLWEHKRVETCHNKYHSSLELKFHEFLYSSGVLYKEKVMVLVLGNRSRNRNFFFELKCTPGSGSSFGSGTGFGSGSNI
jgi:hypothetical protein